MSVIGKNFNGSLYVISDDPTDNDSSHIASIVAVNTVDNSRKHDKEEILNKLEKIGFNARIVITESNDAWISPVTGWARVTVIGGGGGGNIGSGDNGTAYGGGGGAGGEIVTDYVYLKKSTSYSVVIGAGGTKGSVWTTGGAAGGQSNFETIVAKGGNPAKSAFAGEGSLYSPSGTNSQYNSYPNGGGDIGALGGVGGGCGYGRGGDGATGFMKGGTDNKHTDETQGAVIIEYYDSEKEIV